MGWFSNFEIIGGQFMILSDNAILSAVIGATVAMIFLIAGLLEKQNNKMDEVISILIEINYKIKDVDEDNEL